MPPLQRTLRRLHSKHAIPLRGLESEAAVVLSARFDAIVGALIVLLGVRFGQRDEVGDRPQCDAAARSWHSGDSPSCRQKAERIRLQRQRHPRLSGRNSISRRAP